MQEPVLAATFTRGIWRFPAPPGIEMPSFDIQPQDYQAFLQQATLPGVLGGFLTYVFDDGIVIRCDANTNRIRFMSAPNIPGTIGHARINKRLSLMWQALALAVYGTQSLEEPDWRMMARPCDEVQLGAAGEYMAQMMHAILLAQAN